MGQPAPPPLPKFQVSLSAPNLYDWRTGNIGIAGATTRDSGRPGPHVVLFSLTHGNEIAGAIVMDRLMREEVPLQSGRLTCVFANLAAFDRFDPEHPTASRFVDEDFNRIWDPAVLDGPRHSVELSRARELRPLIDTADVLLDIHSMLWASEPLILCGESDGGRRLALRVGTPPIVVADFGHGNGRRIIDYPRFRDPATGAAACLVEAGQHWQPATVETADACMRGVLAASGIVAAPQSSPTPGRLAQVTATVTAETSKFAFVQPWRGGDIVPDRNTLLAYDGEREIRTPHDNCLLVMPSLRPLRGHTAVRIARFVD